MKEPHLQNKPLVEAIVEIRWKLPVQDSGAQIDENYQFMLADMRAKLRKDYPAYEPLPTASIPQEISAYIVQHRFRKSDKCWPLVQLGQGILTLNDTTSYDWDNDYKKRTRALLETLFKVYPESETEKLHINGLAFRYIDAFKFDFENADVFEFLEESLHTSIKPNESLFEGGIITKPTAIDFRLTFPSLKPIGQASLRLTRGKHHGFDVILMETSVESGPEEVIDNIKDCASWLTQAHDLCWIWFEGMTRGSLYESFKG